MRIGTDEGITRILRHGQRTHLTLADGLAQFSIRDLFEDRMHDLWIGTDKILSHGHNGHNTGRYRGGALLSTSSRHLDDSNNFHVSCYRVFRTGQLWSPSSCF